MKKIMLILVVLFSFFKAFGQKYRLRIMGDVKTVSTDAECKHFFDIRFIYKDGSNEIIKNVELKGRENYIFSIGFDKVYDKKKIERIKYLYFTANRGRRNFGKCQSYGISRMKYNINTSCDSFFIRDVFKGNTKVITDNNKITVILNPIIDLKQELENNIIGFDSEFTVNLPSNSLGFNKSVYNWQYQISNSKIPKKYEWKDMPYKTKGETSFTIKPSSFLGKESIGKYILLRINTCKNSESEKFIFYKITVTAPRIDLITSVSPTCHDSKDGEIKVKFDRKLLPNETLNVLLLKDCRFEYDPLTREKREICKNVLTKELAPGETSVTFDNNDSINLENGSYKIKLKGEINGTSTYIDGENHTKQVVLNTTAVKFEETYTENLLCHGSNEGKLTIKAEGGLSNHHYEYLLDNVDDDKMPKWIPFKNGNIEKVTELIAGNYTLKVKGTDGSAECIAKDDKGNVIEKTFTIKEPEELKATILPKIDGTKEPTGFGFSDGRIIVQISGGTPIGGKYNVVCEYKDLEGKISTWGDFSDEISYSSKAWIYRVENAKAGTYTLTITDANYDKTSINGGCNKVITCKLRQPEKLKLTIEEIQPISCNSSNSFYDTSNDGVLKAIASGGVPFESLLQGKYKYKYTWKKKDEKGVYQVLQDETKDVLENREAGYYAVNIEDANGVVIGDLKANVIKPKDVLYHLKEPDLLLVSLTATQISCDGGKNGSIKANVKGGIPPYTYSWSNGDTAQNIKELVSGNYVVFVKDSRGCGASANVSLKAPGGIEIDVNKINPTCYNGADGKISLKVTGGRKPYKYFWKTGEQTSTRQNLKAGSYTIYIEDANKCKFFKEIILENPKKFLIDLGEDKVLCKDQVYELDATIDDVKATYSWSSDKGFSSTKPVVVITKPGIYTVKATSALGCQVSDTVKIEYRNLDIEANFLMSSQAYLNEEVELFNVSDPKPESYEWILPKGVTQTYKTDNSIRLEFTEAKEYKIGLITKQGDCNEVVYKTIVVEKSSGLPDPGDTETPFIKSFVVSPNPNDGNFNITVDLVEVSPVSIRIFNVLGELITAQQPKESLDLYELTFKLSPVSSSYFVVLETAKETQVRTIIIK